MSEDCIYYTRRFLAEVFVIGLVLISSLYEGTAYAISNPQRIPDCRKLEPLVPDSTARYYETDAQRCFEIYLEESGYLMINVSSPLLSRVEPRLYFANDTRTLLTASSDEHRTITKTATFVLLEIRRSGSYAFRVGTQDPRDKLSEFKLRTAWVEIQSEKGNDPLEIEPDPDPFAADCVANGNDPLEIETDPDPLVECAGKGADLASGAAPLERRIRAALCHSETADDHGDTRVCATNVALDRAVGGELRNGWDDDADLFTFVIPELGTVSIVTRGDGDTVGALYDRHGHRLAMDDDDGDGDNFRMVKTLAAGRYFVSVEAGLKGAAGYQLAVKTMDQR